MTDSLAEAISIIEELIDGYLSEADPYSLAGFHRNLSEDECVANALAFLDKLKADGEIK